MNIKHGKCGTKLYDVYCTMKKRCYNKHNHKYYDYGDRGIKICDEWLNNFMTFYNWAMNNGYQEGLSIDRIDVNGNYEPSNCRWATCKTQQNNRRNNVLLTYNNKIQTLKQWADELGMKYITIYKRYTYGWNAENILFGKS